MVAAAVSVDKGVSEPTVPMDTVNSGGVTVSESQAVKKSLVLAKSTKSVPTVPIGTEGTVSDSQLSDVQIAAGDVRNCRLFHKVSNYLFLDSPQVPHLRMFWNLNVKNSHPRIFQLNNFDFHTLVVYRLLKYLLRLMCLRFYILMMIHDDSVIKGFVPNKPRTNNRPSTAPKN